MRFHRSRGRGSRHGPSLAMILLAAASFAPAGAAALDVEVTDAKVGDAIEDELVFDRAVPVNEVDVAVANGIATLRGTVDNLLAKERASAVARTVKGVRSVVNLIDVEPRESVSDSELRESVELALMRDPATDSYEVDVLAAEGTVTLTGPVESWQEKTLVETVAKSVKGVREVANDIEVRYDMDRSDYEMQAEIERALEWDVLVDHALIEVLVADGEATLSGTVGSSAEKNRAISDAWVSGITDVDAGELDVARWARDEDLRRNKYVSRTDEEIQRAIEEALLRDPRVSSFDVQTEVDAGVVTLRGNVDYLKAKRAAEEDARNTVGVTLVENRLKVRPINVLADADIRSRITDALIRDSVVEGYEIDVDVRSGRVTLEGEVDSYFEKFHADEVASRVQGVVSVRNELDVQYDDRMSLYDPYVDPFYFPFGYGQRWDDYAGERATVRTDAEIENDVRDELWWSPFVDADEVEVTVEDGVVTLSGIVHTWMEVSAAIENAYEGGALRVENDLLIKTTA